MKVHKLKRCGEFTHSVLKVVTVSFSQFRSRAAKLVPADSRKTSRVRDRRSICRVKH